MKTTRRDFLKGLFATGAALAVAPHLLVELAHGASDLTPQERDVAAEVMGLRTRQWRGTNLELWINGEWQSTRVILRKPAGLSARITNAKEGEIVVSGLPPEHWFDAQRHLQGAPEREQEILYGVPGGEMPTGVIDSGPTICLKFTEEETVWKYGHVVVSIATNDRDEEGRMLFGQMDVPRLKDGTINLEYARREARRLYTAGSVVPPHVSWFGEDQPHPFFIDWGMYEYGT